jgi:hypothetical protein
MTRRTPMLNIRFIAPVIATCGAALIGFATAAATSTTAEPPAPPASGAPPGPPPEAIAACKGKAEDAAVSFTGRSGEALTGTCQTTNGVLAARPAGGPGGSGKRPPPPR